MQRLGLVATVLATTALLARAYAADLLEPRLLDTPGLVATPSAAAECPSPGGFGPRRYARLIVRDAPRNDVGPYTVQLPGYSTGAENLYRPFLIKTKPGDTLRFDLINQLAAEAGTTNAVNLALPRL